MAAVAKSAPRRPGWLSAAGTAPGPTATDEPHPTHLRTRAAPLRGAGRLCPEQRPGRSRYAYVPGTGAIRSSAGSPPRRRGPFGAAHGRGGSPGVRLLLRGAAAGVGWTWDGAWAPSPLSLRQLRAD